MKSRCASWAAIIALALISINPAFAADTSPPQIVDWQLAESQPNLIPNGATFRSTFVISDESNIDSPKLYLQSTSTSQKSEMAQVTLIKKIGNLTSFEATVSLSKDSAPKEWIWTFSSLRDQFGNIQSKTQNFNLKVNAFNESFTSSDFYYQQRINKEKESYLRTVRLFDNFVKRLDDLLNKYPNDAGLLLAKIKQPNFPRTPPEGDDVIISLMKINELVQEFVDEIDRAVEPIFVAERLAADKVAAERASAIKKTTITCVKGKVTKKVTAVSPKCPAGYKKK